MWVILNANRSDAAAAGSRNPLVVTFGESLNHALPERMLRVDVFQNVTEHLATTKMPLPFTIR